MTKAEFEPVGLKEFIITLRTTEYLDLFGTQSRSHLLSGFSKFIVGGIKPSIITPAAAAKFIAPLALNVSPIMDLMELIGKRLALSPKTPLMALVSITSQSRVELAVELT
jgi:hypothetical protein